MANIIKLTDGSGTEQYPITKAECVYLDDKYPIDKLAVYVTPEMFGAVGDGTTDDINALKTTVTYAITNDMPVFLNGVYLISSPIIVYSGNLQIVGSQGSKIKFSSSFSGDAGFVMASGAQLAQLVFIDVHIEGDVSIASHATAIRTKNVYFNRVSIKNIGYFGCICTGDHTGDAYILNCKADTVYRDSFRCTQFVNAYALNNSLNNIGDDAIALSTDTAGGVCVIKNNNIYNGYGFNVLGRSDVTISDNVIDFARGFVMSGYRSDAHEGVDDRKNIKVFNNIVKAAHATGVGRTLFHVYSAKSVIIKGNILEDADLTSAPATCIAIGSLKTSPAWDKGFYNIELKDVEEALIEDNVIGITTGVAYGSTRKFKFNDGCGTISINKNKIIRFTSQIFESASVDVVGGEFNENYVDSDPDGDLNSLPSVLISPFTNLSYNNTFYRTAKIEYQNPQIVYFTYTNNTIGATGGLSQKNTNVQVSAATGKPLSWPLEYATSMPSYGFYSAGDIVFYKGGNSTILGWKRLTTGTNHVSGTDWKTLYVRTTVEEANS